MTADEIEQWHVDHPYGARDEAYIDSVLEHVKRLWLARPTCRLGQVLVSEHKHYDVFYAQDEHWAKR